MSEDKSTGHPRKNHLSGDIYAVAKISLFESQHDSVEEMFRWSENSALHCEWYETVYSAHEARLSGKEISFIFFLKENEVDPFKKTFPERLKAKLRWESFSHQIYDYYRGRGPVPKHPDTP